MSDGSDLQSYVSVYFSNTVCVSTCTHTVGMLELLYYQLYLSLRKDQDFSIENQNITKMTCSH